MYLVYVDYYNVTHKCGDVKLIYLHDVPDVDDWMKREGFVTKRAYCVRATLDSFIERYLLADFSTAYGACMFSKRAEILAKRGYIDYIAMLAVEFERDIKRRALKSARKYHGPTAQEAAWAASQAEGAGRWGDE
jgi:hypothetical protein